MATTVIRTCDLCDRPIPNTEVFFNAGVYGREAHMECVRHLSAFQLIAFLNLDDIKVMKNEDWQGATRATYEATDWKEKVIKWRQDLNDSITLR